MKNRKSDLIIVLTVIYMAAAVWIILFKMSAPAEIGYLDRFRNVNLIPFHYDEETSSHASEVFSNFLFFIPLGLYMKLLKKSNAYSIALSAAFSLLLETAQYILKLGASDITDLMMNTAGAAAGVMIYSVLGRLFRNHEKLDKVLRILALAGTVLFAALIAVLLLGN